MKQDWSMIPHDVITVIGAQYGSEGKGAIVRWLTDAEQWLSHGGLVIRTGGPQAGHSIRFQDRVFKMQQVPCSWPNRHLQLAMGPGALLEPELVEREIGWAEGEDRSIRNRFFIDPMAAVVLSKHQEEERGSTRLTGRIGSTGEGVGAAQADRVMRSGLIARDLEGPLARYVRPVEDLVWDAYRQGETVVIESTQGYGLSLTRSGLYPTTTSRDITPAQVLNDAAVPHNWKNYVLAVMRTYPIRVAGPSGPMGEEISWEELAKRTDGYVREERTTVTHKVRRVAEFDLEQAQKAVRALQPDGIALTFVDYWYPELADAKELHADAEAQVARMESDLGVPVVLVSTGFQSIIQRRSI